MPARHSPVRNAALAALALALAAGGCVSERRPSRAAPLPPARPGPEPALPVAPAGTELEPGSLQAFGLRMPVGTVERVATESSRVYYVQAPMPRVMRYLQRRLQILTAEIHPLGAMVRNARVVTAPGAQATVVDVGVRDEGDRTLVTVWNRTALPVPPRTTEEGLRAAGMDPRTGRPLPENNY